MLLRGEEEALVGEGEDDDDSEVMETPAMDNRPGLLALSFWVVGGGARLGMPNHRRAEPSDEVSIDIEARFSADVL